MHSAGIVLVAVIAVAVIAVAAGAAVTHLEPRLTYWDLHSP